MTTALSLGFKSDKEILLKEDWKTLVKMVLIQPQIIWQRNPLKRGLKAVIIPLVLVNDFQFWQRNPLKRGLKEFTVGNSRTPETTWQRNPIKRGLKVHEVYRFCIGIIVSDKEILK